MVLTSKFSTTTKKEYYENSYLQYSCYRLNDVFEVGTTGMIQNFKIFMKKKNQPLKIKKHVCLFTFFFRHKILPVYLFIYAETIATVKSLSYERNSERETIRGCARGVTSQ